MSPGAHTLLITGRPGVGKTTALRRTSDRLADLSLRGFYTEEVRDKSGRRSGFRALPFGTPGDRDEARLIASVDVRGGPRVSRYGVDVQAVDGVTARHLTAEGADVVLLDEIGKMECFSQLFTARVAELVDGDLPLVATVARRGGGLIRRVKEAPGTEQRRLRPDQPGGGVFHIRTGAHGSKIGPNPPNPATGEASWASSSRGSGGSSPS